MKEPKFPKLDELPANNKYNFFADGLFPEDDAQKSQKNRSVHKKSRFPFSFPMNYNKKTSNTQKEDDLVPYFAKDYPPSSESKEEVCLINSPPPSDTPIDTGGEAEEVDLEEDESDDDEVDNKTKNNKNFNSKNNNNKKKESKKESNNPINNNINMNMNNDNLGFSADYDSEIENEYEKQSRMLTKEEVRELIRKEDERKRKAEEEFRKKEEERKKKEIEQKMKEKEQKQEKERIERERIEKERIERERIEKERLKKIEEDKKKKLKSTSKKEPLLSTIKKNYDDNMASKSMLNDVKNFFSIPEEKGENDEDEEDSSQRNYKKSSKKISNQIPSKKSKVKEKEIINNKQKEKEKEKEIEKEKEKMTEITRISNGLKLNKIDKDNEKEKENESEEEYSNYGDQLADVENNDESDSFDEPPKKEKVKINKKKVKKLKRVARKVSQNGEINPVIIYNSTQNIRTREYLINNQEGKTFGINGRYSCRTRIPALRHELGERAHYIFKNGLPTLKLVDIAQNNSLRNIFEKAVEKKKKRKLIKKRDIISEEDEEEENTELNSSDLNSDNITEFGEDDARILKIPKGGKKSLAKNYDTILVIKIIEAKGKNVVRVDKKEYKNLKSENKVKVDKNQEFEILNFSDNNLVVQLLFGTNNYY